MLQPLRRGTWAPRGQTPVLDAWDRHSRFSVIGAIALSPQRKRAQLHFQIQQSNCKTPDVMHFLRGLHRELRRPLIVVWDRWSVHRSAYRQLKAEGADWLTAEFLPAYAPELNPVEHVWNHAKYCQMANFVPDDESDLLHHLTEALLEQRTSHQRKMAHIRCARLEP